MVDEKRSGSWELKGSETADKEVAQNRTIDFQELRCVILLPAMLPNGTFNGSLASENDNKSRGSKQKIIQLKDELNGGSLQINPKFEKMKVLRESYEIAKFRANELLLPHDQNLYIKAHGLRASKIYSALSTLIFVSISCSKVEELEDYVMQSAAQVPSSIFDLEEWSSIVKIAKDCREGDSNSLREQIATLKKNMNVYYQLSANPLKAAQMELKLLRSEVVNELGGAQRDLAGSINLIMQLATELQNGTGSKQVQKLNKLIHESDVMERKAEVAKTEELEALREVQKVTFAKVINLEAERSDLTEQLNVATEKLTSNEMHNAQLVAQANELTKELDALKAAAAVSPRRISAEQQAQQVRDFQELYEQYNNMSAALQQRDQQIEALREQLKNGSLKMRIEQDEPEVTVPQPTPQAQIDLENQVSALTQYVTELEHDLEREKRRVKTLSTEVRLNEAARCEAVNFAEECASQLSAARDDIDALQNEADALRDAMRTRNLQDVCITIPPSPRSSFISPSLTKFSPTMRMGASFASIESIVEEVNEDAVTGADDGQSPKEVTAEQSSDRESVVIVETSNAMEDKALIAAEAAHTAASAVFLGTVHVAVMQDEFSHNPPHAAAAVESAAVSSPLAVASETAAPAEKESEKELDNHLISDEAAHTVASAVFLGTVHVAVLQDEFSHNPPSFKEVLVEPTQEVHNDVDVVAEEANPTDLSAFLVVEGDAKEEAMLHEAGADAREEDAVHADTMASVLPEMEPPTFERADESAPSVLLAAEPAVTTTSISNAYTPEDARIVADEASRLAKTAVFLGAVHVAVMQDEFVPHSRPPSVPPAEFLSAEPFEQPVQLTQSKPAAPNEPFVKNNQDAEDKKIISTEASRVVTAAIFGGAVRVAVQQHEFRHHAKLTENPVTASATPVNAAALSMVEETKSFPADSKVIAVEAAHTAASALFLGTVHVAVMQEEFAQHPPRVVDAVESTQTREASQSVAEDSAGAHKLNEEDSHLIADEAARLANSALFLDTVHVAVMQDEFSHNPPHAVAAVESAPVSSPSTVVSERVAPTEKESEQELDKHLISDEAAHTVASAVFLGTVHVAVMQDEFSHNPPHVVVPTSPVEEAVSSSSKQAAAVVSEEANEASNGPKVDTTLLCETDASAVGSEAQETGQAEMDTRIIAQEAAHTAASAVFLGAVQVAVMQEEFAHHPTHTDAALVAACGPYSAPTEPDTKQSAESTYKEISPSIETTTQENDKALIAAEAAHTAASAVFLGTVHVAVMQDEFSHNPPHSAVPVSKVDNSISSSMKEEQPFSVTLPADNSAEVAAPTDNSEQAVELSSVCDTSSAEVKEASAAAIAVAKEANEGIGETESKPVPAERNISTDGDVMPLRTRGRSSSGSKSVKFSHNLTAVEIFETEPVNNSELWTPDPTQKTFSFEESYSPSVSQRSEPEIDEVSIKETLLEAALTAPTAPTEAEEPAFVSTEPSVSGGTQDNASVIASAAVEEAPLALESASSVSAAETEKVSIPWTITAAKDTEQGKHGWYNVNGQLCYYGSDKGEPLLLCGPVTEEVYQMAVAAEAAALDSAASLRPTATEHTVVVDRIGVRATRLQAEYLREEMLNLEHKHTQAVQELEEAHALTEAELFDCQAAVRTLHEEIAQCQEIIKQLEGDRRRNQLNRQQTEIFDQKVAVLTIEQVVALIKLTSIVRGFLGRARVRRLQVSKLAKEAGILHAMANTKQGEAGWYMGPKGNIFYFVIKNGMWTTVAGPLTREEFELMMLARKQKQVSNSQEVLTMCRVPLQADWAALVDGGELYVANVSDKVFVCKPLDAVIAAAYPAPSMVLDSEPVEREEIAEDEESGLQEEEAQSEKAKEPESTPTRERRSQKIHVETADENSTATSEKINKSSDSPVPVTPSASGKGLMTQSQEQAVDFNNPVAVEQQGIFHQASVDGAHSPGPLSLEDAVSGKPANAADMDEAAAKGWRWQ